MPDEQQLSAQDMQDLQDIAAHLPTGHPMQGKLSVLLNSQPTQFEKDRTPDANTGGFWGGAKSAIGANNPAPSTGQAIKEGVLAGMPGVGMAQSLYGAAKNAVPNYKAGGAAGILGPLVGVDPQSMAARADRGDTAGILGEAAVPTALALTPFAGEGAARGAKAAAKLAPGTEGMAAKMREFAGTGEDLTTQKVKAWQEKNSEVTGHNQQSLAAARSAHETEVGDIERANEKATTDAQDKWVRRAQVISDANKKGEAQVALRKQLEQEAKQHGADLTKHLPELAKQAFEEGKAKYAAADVNGVADSAELHKDLQSVVDQKLKGVGGVPPVLSKIMKTVEPPPDLLSQASVFGGAGKAARDTGKGPVMSETFRKLNNLDDPERAGYTAPEGEEPPDFNKLHEMMSDLGNAAAKAKMPDERAALWEAHNVIDSHMKKLSDAEGKTALFQDAQKTYNQNFNTFRKTWKDAKGEASPIARALQSKDPVSGEILPGHAADILLKDKNYTLAKQLLDRYPSARTDLLNQLKDKADRIKDLPESFNPKPLPTQAVIPQTKMPTSQSIPGLKDPPEALDIPGDKAEIIRKKAEMLGSFQGRGAFIDTAAAFGALTGHPAGLVLPIVRRILAKKLAANAKSGGSLTHLTPNEVKMIKSTQIYPNKKAALAAKGNVPRGPL